MSSDAPGRIVEVLRAADSVALACHINPDGDALGSLLGAALALKALGKNVSASWDGAPNMPAGYGFLPGQDAIVPPERLPDADVFLALDCGARDRLGSLEDKVDNAKITINIDHHPGNDEFGDIDHVVVTASSTAELVAGIVTGLGIEMDRDIATCLYTGIFTDTGGFQYTNTTPDTLRLAAGLLELGVPKTQIAQEVFMTAPFGFLKLIAGVLSKAQLRPEHRFIYSTITRTDLQSTGVAIDETDMIIELLRSTRDADIVALFKEQDDGSFRVSMRAKEGGSVSVGAIARSQGGGGHDLAAGFTVDAVDPAVDAIVRHLEG